MLLQLVLLQLLFWQQHTASGKFVSQPWIPFNFSFIEEANASDSLWDIHHQKGVMKGQNLRMSKIKQLAYATCYEAECIGNSCPADHNRLLSFCYPAVIITGLPKCGTSAMYAMLAQFPNAVLMDDKENCPYSRRRSHWKFFQSLPNYKNVKYDSLIIDGCIDTSRNILMRSLLRKPSTLYIILTRDYGSMLWSAYNFWCNWSYDGSTCDNTRWSKPGLHRRSPEAFHDIVSGDRNGTKVPSPISHNSHPCINANSYFTDYIVYFLSSVPANTTMIFASEQMESRTQLVWERIAKRLKMSLPPDTIANLTRISKYRHNTQNASQHVYHKGFGTIPSEAYRPGLFAVSNFTSLLDSTKRLLSECWLRDCVLVSLLTGHLYPSCAIDVERIGGHEQVMVAAASSLVYGANPLLEPFALAGLNFSLIKVKECEHCRNSVKLY